MPHGAFAMLLRGTPLWFEGTIPLPGGREWPWDHTITRGGWASGLGTIPFPVGARGEEQAACAPRSYIYIH